MAATVSASVVLTTAALALSAGSAGAAPRQVCTLLPVLCPTTTVRPATATTRAPGTTTPPPAPSQATRAPAKSTTTVTTKKATATVVGVGPAAVLGAGIDPASLGQDLASAAAPSAPELAGTANPADVQASTAAMAPGDLAQAEALAGAASGALPSNHTGLRILLSGIALGIAGLAAAQLPASRRRLLRPSPMDEPEVIDGL